MIKINNNVKQAAVIIVILVVLLLAVKYDFFTNSIQDILNKKIGANSQQETDPKIKEEVEQEINDLVNMGKMAANDDLEVEMARLDGFSKLGENQKNSENLVEGFQNNQQPLNNRVEKTVTLFYSSSCPHSQAFFPTWQLIKENLPADTEYVEVECHTEKNECKRNHVESIPSILLEVDEDRRMLEGNRDYQNIVEECKLMGINLHQQEVENFVDYISAHVVEGDTRKTTDPDCPYISFYKSGRTHYCADSNEIYGCTDAGPGSGVHPFDAAYSVVGGYLNSLPDNSPKNMNKCAATHKNMIRTFGLCDAGLLATKSKYATNVAEKTAKDRFLKVNYQDNKNITNAINHACSA